MIANDTGKIIVLKNGDVYSREEILSGEIPVKYLIVEDNDDHYVVAPMFYGYDDADYNEYTLMVPFINMNISDEIRCLNLQTNRLLEVPKQYAEFYSEHQFKISNLNTTLFLYSNEGTVPEIVEKMIVCFNEIIKINVAFESINTATTNIESSNFIQKFINNAKIALENTFEWIAPLPTVASSCEKIIQIDINNFKAKVQIKVIESKKLEQIIAIKISPVRAKRPVTIMIRLVVDGRETENFMIGGTQRTALYKELHVKDVPWLKKDSTINRFILGVL